MTIIFLAGTLSLLFVSCNRPPLTKLNNDLVLGSDVKAALIKSLSPTGGINDYLTRPYLVQILTGIDDSSYYTRKSLDACKEKLYLLAILQNNSLVLATCKIEKAKAI